MRKDKGFTLIEMIVVTIIMGTLASLAIPKLMKTVETSRAYDALGILNNVAAGVRMFKTDWPAGSLSPTAGLTTAVNTAACPATGKPTTVAELLGCKYITPHDWDNYRYQYYVCEGNSPAGTCCAAAASGENRVACADRRNTDPVSGDATSSPYSGWLFWMDNYGGCHSGTGSQNPSCPKV